MTTVDANGVTLGVEHFGDAAAATPATRPATLPTYRPTRRYRSSREAAATGTRR